MTDSVVIGGLGIVGTATRNAFGIDKYFDTKESNITLKEAADCIYVFVCLPTPVKDGRYVTEDISSIVSQIASYGKQNIFIIRSTVFPGFANNLMKELGIRSVISNPEFLTMSTKEDDTKFPDIVVIGGYQDNYIDNVASVYQGRYKGATIFKTDNTTAELAKLAINGFYATKVVFANQVYDYAQVVGANYERVKEIMYGRKWIGKNHLDVWHKGGRGAGGRCLKKDLEAMAEYSQLPLFKQAVKINNILLMSNHKEEE